MLPNKPTLLPVLRDEYFSDYCTDRKVLHIGACDAPFTEQKFDDRLLLHMKLDETASELVGVDVDARSIEFLRGKGISNILEIDMNQLDTIDFEADVIIFGETIEHLDNTRNSLTNLTRAMKQNTRLLISTPNALSLLNVFNALFRTETCHPDHVVNFTPLTLAQCLAKNGLIVEALHFTFLNRMRPSGYKRVWRLIARLFPWYAETLIVSCRLK